MAQDGDESEQQYKPEMRKAPIGQMMVPSRKTNGVGVQAEETRICVVMVGLPARGKSLIASKGKALVTDHTVCSTDL